MSVNNGMRPVHPGEILREELEELGLSANALAKALDVPTNRITAILRGQRGVRLIRPFALPDTSAPRPNCGRTFRRHTSCAWRRSNRVRRSRSGYSAERQARWLAASWDQ